MIPLRNLRIGNWIETVVGEERWVNKVVAFPKVEYIAVPVVQPFIRVGVKTDRITVGEEQCFPILLTTEILEKCGFENRSGYWSSIKEDFEVSKRNSGFYFSVNINEYEVGEPFFYVHQLQNLFLAITQKELEINL